MIDNILLENFGKKNAKSVRANSEQAVIYTRVSTKDQAENNLSLGTQKKMCEQYAKQVGLSVIQYFGGTYESAKTDERKEFNKMLGFIRKRRPRVGHIIVYDESRFSRTGYNGMYIAECLKQEGVLLHSATSPVDTTTAAGTLQQQIKFIFNHFDNQMRKQRTVTGMTEKLMMGIWLGTLPLGYDRIKKNGETQIVLNEKGELLRKAFHWKAEEGISTEEIIKRLAALGFKINKQTISRIFRNVFYCGFIAHNFLDGKIVEGKQEKMVSKELFLQVNGLLQKNKQKYHHSKENEFYLRRFVKCGECGTSFAGYMVKQKGVSYYKCNKKGCRCNRRAEKLHEQFAEYIQTYQVNEMYVEPLKFQLEQTFNDLNKDNIENKRLLEAQAKEIQKKLDGIEERYVLGEINKELYDKYSDRFKSELNDVLEKLNAFDFNLSNLSEYIETSLTIACKLGSLWLNGEAKTKETLQYLVFPEGIMYDRKNSSYRTERSNSVFEVIRCLSDNL
jgi:DNA invertase Pin-like site-specific DNA recombinase